MSTVDVAVAQGDLQARVEQLERERDRLRDDLQHLVDALDAGEDVAEMVPRIRRHLQNTRHQWTRDLILDKVVEWTERYGTPPSAVDWSPSLARLNAGPTTQEKVARFYEGDWPRYSTTNNHFDSWSQMIEAAGFSSQPRGGQHGEGGRTAGATERLPEWRGWGLIDVRREKLHLTRAQVAHAASINVGTLGRIAVGEHNNPGIRVVLAVASALGLPARALVE